MASVWQRSGIDLGGKCIENETEPCVSTSHEPVIAQIRKISHGRTFSNPLTLILQLDISNIFIFGAGGRADGGFFKAFSTLGGSASVE